MGGDAMKKSIWKEVKTMNYSKPEILILGDASRIIQGVHDKSVETISDSPQDGLQTLAAYDLDE
jgi:hypothetical protein